MSHYQFMSCHPVTRQQLDPFLRFVNPSWSWIVKGNGVLTADIPLPRDTRKLESLKVSTAPKRSAIYVKNQAGSFVWGGPVVSRVWVPREHKIKISCVEWRAWLFMVRLTPAIDMSADIQDSWSQVDQIQIARDLITYGITGGEAEGRPAILLDEEPLSGKLRDLNVYGTAMKSVGELIDTMANRDGGFEWTIDSRPDPEDGLPRQYFAPSYPERGTLHASIMFKHTRQGGNLIEYGPVEEEATTQYDRFWATGAGQAPDQVFAQDTDP